MSNTEYVVMRDTCYYLFNVKTGTISWTPFRTDATRFRMLSYAEAIANKLKGVVCRESEEPHMENTTYTLHVILKRFHHATIQADFMGVQESEVGALRLQIVVWAQSIEDATVLTVRTTPTETLTEPA